VKGSTREAGQVMSLPGWREESIAKKHDRASFDCGEPALNEFLRQHARQSHDKGAAKPLLAISESDRKAILGFYSLCPASLEYARAPEIVRKGLARHDVGLVFGFLALGLGRIPPSTIPWSANLLLIIGWVLF
jgi:hypothetical protein